MAVFDRYPSAARPLIAALTVLLVGTAAVTFVNYASSPTDENVFATLPDPMTMYVTKSVRAVPVKLSISGTYDPREGAMEDSVRVGDLIRMVNRVPVLGPADLSSAIMSVPSDSAIIINVYRPVQRMFLAYRVRRYEIPDSFAAVVTDCIAVVDVTAGGASDRAGMKVGDLILRINGEGFTNAQEADLILRRAQTGKTITYEVVRNNERLTLNVTLARFGFPLPLLGFSLAGMFMMALGGFIALRRPRLRAARVLGTAFLLIGYFTTVVLIRRDADIDAFILVRNAMVSLSLLFGVALMAWSGALFPKERPDILAKRWIPVTGGGLVVLTLISRSVWDDRSFLAGLAAIVLYAIVLYGVHRKNTTPEQKKMSRVITWTSIGVGAVSVAISIAGGLLRVQNILLYVGLAIFAIPLSYLYTIGRYRLLDLNLRVKRNIQYSLVSIAWGALLGCALITILFLLPGMDLHLPAIVIRGMSIEAIDDPAAGPMRDWTNRFAIMALGVGSWYFLWRLRKAGQTWIDRKYDRTQYDYRRAVSELAEVLSTKLSMIDLGKGLAERLSELMQVKRAGVFFFRQGAVSACQEAVGIDSREWVEFCSPVEQALPSVLAAAGENYHVDYLPAAMKDAFRRHEFYLLVPVRSKNRLLGAMVLGEKRSEATYRHEDHEFLAAAASQASVAMENAFLYEELAEKERMKHELDIARRIQLASLPQHTPALQGLEIAGASVPALEVGGDFFDYLNGAADRMTLVVGDVSGKGTSAALYMSKVQGILRSLHGFGLSPGDLFIRANRLLCNDLEKKSFVTAFCAAFDPHERKIVMARAGHLPLYHYRLRDRRVDRVLPRGLGLGLNNAGVFSSELEERELRYEHGDVLLFVTDGVTEAQNGAGEQFGEERVMALLAENAGRGAADLRDAMFSAVNGFVGGATQHDDETVVVVKGT